MTMATTELMENCGSEAINPFSSEGGAIDELNRLALNRVNSVSISPMGRKGSNLFHLISVYLLYFFSGAHE